MEYKHHRKYSVSVKPQLKAVYFLFGTQCISIYAKLPSSETIPHSITYSEVQRASSDARESKQGQAKAKTPQHASPFSQQHSQEMNYRI